MLWEPKDANHCGASTAEPAEYERRVLGGLRSHKSVVSRLVGTCSIGQVGLVVYLDGRT